MPNAKNLTTISVTRENYEILKNLGHTGESFNTVITRLVNSNKKKVVGEPTRQRHCRETTTPEPQAIIVNGK